MTWKKKIIISTLVIIGLVLVGVLVGVNLRSNGPDDVSPYSAVYLKTGDMYFGRLESFPKLRLTEAWFLERGTDKNNQPQVRILPLTSSFWGPVNVLYLNPQEVTWWTRLRSDSKLVPILKNPRLLDQQQSLPQSDSPEATSTPGNNKTKQ